VHVGDGNHVLSDWHVVVKLTGAYVLLHVTATLLPDLKYCASFVVIWPFAKVGKVQISKEKQWLKSALIL